MLDNSLVPNVLRRRAPFFLSIEADLFLPIEADLVLLNEIDLDFLVFLKEVDLAREALALLGS